MPEVFPKKLLKEYSKKLSEKISKNFQLLFRTQAVYNKMYLSVGLRYFRRESRGSYGVFLETTGGIKGAPQGYRSVSVGLSRLQERFRGGS